MSRWPDPGDPAFSGFWSEHHAAVESKGTNPFLAVVERHLPPPGRAIDLGAGTGRHSVWLLERGFSVEAIDADPVALECLRGRVAPCLPLAIRVARFEEATLPPSDLVLSVFSLFFTRPDHFDRVWDRIRAALRPGGVFAGQFLGPRDEWAGTGLATQGRSEVEGLLSGLETLHLDEVERDGRTAEGSPKRWHVFHVVARNSG